MYDRKQSKFQVTVLLFREGDKVNLYHVIEKPDGSFSPIADLNENDENYTENSSNSSTLTDSISKHAKRRDMPKKRGTYRYVKNIIRIQTI